MKVADSTSFSQNSRKKREKRRRKIVADLFSLERKSIFSRIMLSKVQNVLAGKGSKFPETKEIEGAGEVFNEEIILPIRRTEYKL